LRETEALIKLVSIWFLFCGDVLYRVQEKRAIGRRSPMCTSYGAEKEGGDERMVLIHSSLELKLP
jgi:hypothetical protein